MITATKKLQERLDLIQLINYFIRIAGDGGNPMLCQRSDSCQWFLSGMVSQGRGDGNNNYPGIYTNIVDVEAWIKAELGTDLAGQC